MSIWTHVVGCIRIDGLPGLAMDVKSIEKIIGPMSLYDDLNNNSTLPTGSEGSLQYRIIEYDTGLPWVAVPIWGDLRDFDNAQEIKEWWENVLSKFQIVRDAILLIQVENRTKLILEYKPD